jgi:hypothetical protein
MELACCLPVCACVPAHVSIPPATCDSQGQRPGGRRKQRRAQHYEHRRLVFCAWWLGGWKRKKGDAPDPGGSSITITRCCTSFRLCDCLVLAIQTNLDNPGDTFLRSCVFCCRHRAITRGHGHRRTPDPRQRKRKPKRKRLPLGARRRDGGHPHGRRPGSAGSAESAAAPASSDQLHMSHLLQSLLGRRHPISRRSMRRKARPPIIRCQPAAYRDPQTLGLGARPSYCVGVLAVALQQ